MAQLPFLDAATIRQAVPMGELLDAVEAAFREVAAGRDRSPLRSHVSLDAGDLLLMPGVREGGAGATVKLVTVVPANADRGLPTVQALVVWFDAETGQPLALLDGATVTAMRTGAASGVATRLLARPGAHVLALFGAGAQAEWQLRGVLAARPIDEVRVVTRHRTGREAFAERMGAELGIGIEAVASAAEALDGADLVCCASTSATPIFSAEAVAPGSHVNGIGAFRLEMVEMPPELYGRSWSRSTAAGQPWPRPAICSRRSSAACWPRTGMSRSGASMPASPPRGPPEPSPSSRASAWRSRTSRRPS